MDKIVASSVQWGVGRSVANYAGGSRESSTPNFSEMTFTKMFDISSNDIAKAASNGTDLGEVTISFRKDAGAAGLDYLVYTLAHVIISSYSVSSGGETPSESVSLNYTTIKSVYKKLANEHADAGENEFEYDVQKQT